jgi:hypothetical protein
MKCVRLNELMAAQPLGAGNSTKTMIIFPECFKKPLNASVSKIGEGSDNAICWPAARVRRVDAQGEGWGLNRIWQKNGAVGQK